MALSLTHSSFRVSLSPCLLPPCRFSATVLSYSLSAPNGSSEEAAMAGKKTILIVDDDYELIDGLRALLEKQGYNVLQAHDGHQGKQLIQNQKPDLVILDMMMPRMGGYPVLEYFRGKPDAPPIIMITANEGSRHKAYAEYLGVVDYIRKPFAMERLFEAVNKAFNAPAKTDEAGAN
jgi:DNA-binding response OmpR family regulator